MRTNLEHSSMPDVVAIPKIPQSAVEKVKCSKCKVSPGGYRGPHELQRHVERAHTTMRKAWICVDLSPNKTFLA